LPTANDLTPGEIDAIAAAVGDGMREVALR
jgi:hypothetical protein